MFVGILNEVKRPVQQLPLSPERKMGVLIVDDEAYIRHLLSCFLQNQGCTTFQASNGVEALQTFQLHEDEIQIALLDVRMPTMDGPTTLRNLKRLHPNLRVCLMSGDTGNYQSSELLDMGADCLFEKPLRLDELLPRLRQLSI